MKTTVRHLPPFVLIAFLIVAAAPWSARWAPGGLLEPGSQSIASSANGAGPGPRVSSAGYWTNVTPSYGPVFAGGATIAYVPELGGTLLFGRTGASPVLNRTWLYNSSRNNWTTLAPTSPVPPMFAGASMVYDPDSGKVVLHAGIRVFEDLCVRATNDTWLYDPLANTWTNVTPPDSPPPRIEHAMTYDPMTHRVVLFGGLDLSCRGRIPEYIGPRLDDTWVYDVATNTWTNVTSPVAPPARSVAGLAYDPDGPAIVLFGGAPVDQRYPGSWALGDTWSLDPTTYAWDDVHPESRPPDRAGAQMIYDADARAVVMYGGCGYGKCDRDAWWYDAPSEIWMRMSSADSPDFSYTATLDRLGALAYDPRGVLVAYGNSETWEYHAVRGVEPLVAWASGHATNAAQPRTLSFTISVTGGVPPYRYSWAFGDGETSSDANPVHTYPAPGDYRVTVVVTDAADAYATSSVGVSVPSLAASGEWMPYAASAAVVVGGGSLVVWWWTRGPRARIRRL